MSLPLTHAGGSVDGISATLDLKFASTLSLTSSSGITPSFSRASSGTYFGSDGLLKYAGTNLINYSEDFTVSSAGNWTDNTNTTITANQGVSPDGTMTADLARPTATGSNSLGSAGKLITYPGSGTTSIYAKASGKIWIRIWDANGYYPTWFNLSTGTVGTVGSGFTASIQNVGNGWYRCSVARTLVGSNGYFYFGISDADNSGSATATGTDGVLVWGAQLETGTTATTYGKTLGAANSAPRFDHAYNGSAWVSKGLLVEEQRTNLCLDGNNFPSSNWTKNNSSVSSSATGSPDGAVNANKLKTNNGSTYGSVYQSFGGKSYGNINYVFNLTTGALTQTYGTATSYSVIDCGNDWKRISLTVSGDTVSVFAKAAEWNFISIQFYSNSIYFYSDNSSTPFNTPVTGNGSSGIYIYGAQLESGSFPTSYIPTTSASATRSADVCQITGSDFSSFWNATEGSFAVEYDRLASITSSFSQGYPRYFTVDDGTLSNRMGLLGYTGSPSNEAFYAVTGGLSQGDTLIGASSAGGVVNKISFAYKSNDAAGSLNGAAVISDSTFSVPTVSKMQIGYYDQSTTSPINGHIARLRYFNKRLTNAQLVKMST